MELAEKAAVQLPEKFLQKLISWNYQENGIVGVALCNAGITRKTFWGIVIATQLPDVLMIKYPVNGQIVLYLSWSSSCLTVQNVIKYYVFHWENVEGIHLVILEAT